MNQDASNSKNGQAHGLSTAACSEPVDLDWISCPECGGKLTVQWDGDDIAVDCENEPDMDDDEAVENDIHRYWQQDWQPVMDRIREWIFVQNAESRNPETNKGDL